MVDFSIFLLLFLIYINNVFTQNSDSFFGDVRRAEYFEKTDFKMPKITINLNDEDYKNFFLTYQCLHDTNSKLRIRNDDCYTAPWVNLDETLEGVFNNSLIEKKIIKDSNDLKIINNKKITLSDFEHIITKYSNYTIQDILSSAYGLYNIPDYEAKNAGMTYSLKDDVQTFESIKFSVGGKYTKAFEKLGFNIKIKKGLLYERKQFRLRSESVDPAFIREKLAYDICNLIGLPSLSSNFARLYFNKKFMGLYSVRDAFKPQWIEYTFGEASTKHLYTCDSSYDTTAYFNCKNDDEDIHDDQDWKNFIKRLSKVKTRSDLEEFFDVSTFMKWQAIKYLFGSWDHVTNAHNQYLYMYHDTTSGNDKWIPLLYDFDSEFGAYKDPKPHRSFYDDTLDYYNPIHQILELNDKNEELISYIDEFMRKAFNPLKLIPRIDQLKVFISKYVKEDRTPDENGVMPGRLKRDKIKIEDSFSYDDFLGNLDYTTIILKKYSSEVIYKTDKIYGLKEWIIERFNFACEFYKLDCSYIPKSLNFDNYEHKVVEYNEKTGYCHNSGYSCCKSTTKVISGDGAGDWGYEFNDWCLFDESAKRMEELYHFKKEENTDPTSDNNKGNDKEKDENNVEDDGSCWSLAEGFPCCENKDTLIIFIESGRGWGVENGHWCGILNEDPDDKICPKSGEYSCCKGCQVYYTDDIEWGVENNEWCSIPYKCKKSNSSLSTTTTTTTTTTATSTPTVIQNPEGCSTLSPGFSPCGGKNYPNASPCCEKGFRCEYHNKYLFVCVPLVKTTKGIPSSTTSRRTTTTTTTTTTMKITTTTTTAQLTTTTTRKSSTPTATSNCWSLSQGYPCCVNKDTQVKYTSSNGNEWGIENDNWCGITDLQRCPSSGNYKCCKTCNVYYVDSLEWGYEQNSWCLIPYSCKTSTTTKLQ